MWYLLSGPVIVRLRYDILSFKPGSMANAQKLG